MEPPIVFRVEGEHSRECSIHLYNNVYVIKDAGIDWFDNLKECLEARGFVQYQVDPYVWYREEIVLLFYVDSFLMFSPSKDIFIMSMLLYRKI